MNGWEPTHRTARATRAWASSDQSQAPAAEVIEGLNVRVLQVSGDMSEVEFSNKWIGWIDKHALVQIGVPTSPPAAEDHPQPIESVPIHQPSAVSSIALVGAGLALIASFLPWVGSGVGSFNAWRIPLLGLFNSSALSWFRAGIAMLVVCLVAIPFKTKRRLNRWILVLIGSVPGDLAILTWNQSRRSGIGGVGVGEVIALIGGLIIAYEFIIRSFLSRMKEQ